MHGPNEAQDSDDSANNRLEASEPKIRLSNKKKDSTITNFNNRRVRMILRRMNTDQKIECQM
ncbi:hypothetical protein KP509_31G029900 [Ceratopteris richardii]|uniref:Uncharacterized protein n=1 Tax=Ceratopteris richardii TaxID=49495 RepID=A0A8T2QWT2_CERRI|nr:hypothetical protein KP509_31G029900 [Ceratopteris richardii]